MSIITYASAGFAFIAAALWFWSARVRLPDAIRAIDDGFINDEQPKPVDDLDRLTMGLTRQSRLSALAAFAAAISAVLQGVATALT
jgi:hypothetical protein